MYSSIQFDNRCGIFLFWKIRKTHSYRENKLKTFYVRSKVSTHRTKDTDTDTEIGDEEDDDDDVDEEEDDDDDDEDNADVSLADVYNDDLDEDNSDYVEEGDGEEDDDIDSEEDEANESATGQPQAPAAEESLARGKKRKHDG